MIHTLQDRRQSLHLAASTSASASHDSNNRNGSARPHPAKTTEFSKDEVVKRIEEDRERVCHQSLVHASWMPHTYLYFSINSSDKRDGMSLSLHSPFSSHPPHSTLDPTPYLPPFSHLPLPHNLNKQYHMRLLSISNLKMRGRRHLTGTRMTTMLLWRRMICALASQEVYKTV